MTNLLLIIIIIIILLDIKTKSKVEKEKEKERSYILKAVIKESILESMYSNITSDSERRRKYIEEAFKETDENN